MLNCGRQESSSRLTVGEDEELFGVMSRGRGPSAGGRGRGHVASVTLLAVVCGFLFGMWSQSAVLPCFSLPGPHTPRTNTAHTPVLPEEGRQFDPHQGAAWSYRHGNQHHGNQHSTFGEDQPATNRPNLVFIGVMTARKYLNTRVKAAYDTWFSSIPGKVIFFSCAGSEKYAPQGIPVIGLPGVDDSYPPQKKSFMMIKYMHDHFLDQYEFFMRADDDVYIRGEKLGLLLRSINSSRPLFMGQAGQGNKQEQGSLSLQPTHNFCMGGPSMVFSRATLQHTVPHVSYCLKNLYTTHEDVEIGRCVQKFADVSCTWAFEMQRLFYNNYREPQGSFTHSLKTKEVHRAITLHPVKNHVYQYRMHQYSYQMKAAQLRQKVLSLQREVHAMTEQLQDRDDFYSPNKLGLPPSLLKTVPHTRDQVLVWDFFTRYIFSTKSTNPKRGLELSLRAGLEDIVNQVMEMINHNARQRGRTIDFKEVLYGYHRVNPLHGADYILDLLLVYRKHKGKRKMTVPVRRHAYIQQTFVETEFSEANTPVLLYNRSVAVPGKEPESTALLHLLKNKLGALYHKHQPTATPTAGVSPPTIHFLLPLAGRFQTLLQFMHNFEEVCLQQRQRVLLAVMLFDSDSEDRVTDTISLIEGYQSKYPSHKLQVVRVTGPFSRGLGLQQGSALFPSSALLCFIDVDMYLRSGLMQRLQLNTVQGKQVYYPIVFSHYDPHMQCAENDPCPSHRSPFDFHENRGYWRQFGFGIAAMFRSDLEAVGGFDTDILGWGKEDVDLFERFIKNNVTIFRAVDPGLVHIFHAVVCDPSLEMAQYQMCLGSKAATYGSTGQLADLVYNTPEILHKDEPAAEVEEANEEDEAPNDEQGN